MKFCLFKYRVLVLFIVPFLTYCTANDKKVEQKTSMESTLAMVKPISNNSDVMDKPNDKTAAISHLTQCKRDLESLHRISPSEYTRYRDEYDALMRSSSGFMAVSGDISDEVSDLARPRFQFALVNLCYRIKNALAQTLISQAGGEGAR